MTRTRTSQYSLMCLTLNNTKEPTVIAKSEPSKFYQSNRLSQPWLSSIRPIFRLCVHQTSCLFGCMSVTARFLGLRTRIPQGPCMSVSCECCLMSGRGLWGGPIPRPEESYRLCVCVCVCVCVSLSMIICNNYFLQLQ